MTSKEYLDNLYSACGDKLVAGPIYKNREGHLRLAREIGYALNDFSDKDKKEILKTSYSVIYVRACFLKPLLDAHEWISEILKGASRSKEAQ